MQLTQIVNGQVTELILCEECAKKKGLFDPQSLSFAEKFFPEELKKKVEEIVKELTGHTVNAGAPESKENTLDMLAECPVCHFTRENHRRTGRFGCPACYDTFEAELKGTLVANDNHAVEESELTPEQLKQQLEKRMKEAIAAEDYETAAALRDKLKELN